MKTYSDRLWLNKNESPSTGSVVAFDGTVKEEDGTEWRSTFLQIGDCYGKVKLHKACYDTQQDFIEKMKKLRGVIDKFIHHLEENQ